MVSTQVFLAVRALAHLIRKTPDMSGCDKNCLLRNGGTFDLVITFLYDIKIPPDILDPPLHHRAERPVIDESRHGTIAFRCRPDKSTAFGKFHHVLKNIVRTLYHLLPLLLFQIV
jgi:hypothetical protein